MNRLRYALDHHWWDRDYEGCGCGWKRKPFQYQQWLDHFERKVRKAIARASQTLG